MHFRMLYSEIREMASKHGWEEIDLQEDQGMISFGKMFGGHWARINVWTTRMTIGTYITHPRKGKTQLFRRHVSRDLLDAIFRNPRIHSGIGYSTK